MIQPFLISLFSFPLDFTSQMLGETLRNVVHACVAAADIAIKEKLGYYLPLKLGKPAFHAYSST